MVRKPFLLNPLVWILPFIAACTPQGTTQRVNDEPQLADAARAVFRLIIRFTPGTHVDDGFIARLSGETGVTFNYVRPMAGDAHVLTITTPLNDRQRATLLQTLAKRKDVVYAEEDRRMYPMQVR